MTVFSQIKQALFPKKKSIKSKKQVLLTIVLLFVAAWVGSEIPNRLMVAITNSVGHRIFYYERDQKDIEITKNSFVVFELESEFNTDCNPCRVVKKAACIEGEQLKTTAFGYYYCGDQYLGVSKNITPSGKELSPFVYNGVIPEGKFFAFGGNVNSYDSRYFGFIENDVVEGVAKPLL
jgi:type IV secretory pathway protease TraF